MQFKQTFFIVTCALGTIFNQFLFLDAQTTYLFCNYEEECAFTEIDTSYDQVYCNGYEACESSNISTLTISCGGDYACRNSRIDQACTVLETCALRVYGSYGLYNSYILSTDRIYAYGASALLYATLDSGGDLWCSGYFSCYLSTIMGSYDIIANDYLSIAKAEIFTNGHTIDMTASGYYSGYNSNVYCETDDVCRVLCQTDETACYGMTVYCYSGATCTINCDFGTTYCPTVNYYLFESNSQSIDNNNNIPNIWSIRQAKLEMKNKIDEKFREIYNDNGKARQNDDQQIDQQFLLFEESLSNSFKSNIELFGSSRSRSNLIFNNNWIYLIGLFQIQKRGGGKIIDGWGILEIDIFKSTLDKFIYLLNSIV